jgi:hypothetical protein
MTSPHRTVATLPIRKLDVQAEEGAPHFIAAASGMVRIGQRLYVVADDAMHLARCAGQLRSAVGWRFAAGRQSA